MPIDHVLSLGWQHGSNALSQNVTVSSEGEDNREVTVNAATNDVQVAVAFPIADLKLIYIHSDRDVTLETNSASVPAQTFTISANKPFVWYTGCGIANPFTTAVTAIFLSNAGAAAATVKIKLLKDSTP